MWHANNLAMPYVLGLKLNVPFPLLDKLFPKNIKFSISRKLLATTVYYRPKYEYVGYSIIFHYVGVIPH